MCHPALHMHFIMVKGALAYMALSIISPGYYWPCLGEQGGKRHQQLGSRENVFELSQWAVYMWG